MAYAVVTFHQENNVSEVPVSWLSQDRAMCYWPAKNAKTLIESAAEPNNQATDNWYPIQLECICDSLKEARSKAINMSASEDEDEYLGRGLRRKKRILPFSPPPTLAFRKGSTLRLSPPPSPLAFQKLTAATGTVNSQSSYKLKNAPATGYNDNIQSPFEYSLNNGTGMSGQHYFENNNKQRYVNLENHSDIYNRGSYEAINGMYQPRNMTEKCYYTLQSRTVESEEPCNVTENSYYSLQSRGVDSQEIASGSSASSLDHTLQSTGVESQEIASGSSATSLDHTLQSSAVESQDVASGTTGTSTSSLDFQKRNLETIPHNLRDWLRSEFKKITNRLDDLKLGQEQTLQALNKKSTAPMPLEWSKEFSSAMKNLDEVKRFNENCKEKDFSYKYHKLIKQIGGKGPRDHVARVLRTIMNDELGQRCAWTNQRNNTPISEMEFIVSMYTSLQTVYPGYTKKEFQTDVT